MGNLRRAVDALTHAFVRELLGAVVGASLAAVDDVTRYDVTIVEQEGRYRVVRVEVTRSGRRRSRGPFFRRTFRTRKHAANALARAMEEPSWLARPVRRSTLSR
jgi:hypothetical protein